tara:strand:- start:8567 stop:8908 length:342 start_codon:yes stop_codon:yes gene_type:complete
MSKMGQYVIELTEKRIAEYYGYSNRNGRTTAEAKSAPTEPPVERVIDGPEFFSGDTGRGLRPEAEVGRSSPAEGYPLPAEAPESKEVQRVQGCKRRSRGHEGALHQGAGDAGQ